jgi:AcrR family transcriptional regulator
VDEVELKVRRRAPGMSPEKRREMIIHAVLPLVIEHGAAVTTSQIARAAGIGEATVFRAFTDKDELLDACIAEALRPETALDAIAEIPLDLPLAERLIEAADALSAHLTRMGAVLSALHASGYRRERKRGSRDGRRESLTDIREALTDLFTPETDQLRMPPEHLAVMVTHVLMAKGRSALPDGPTTAQIVDVLLHGAFI